MKTLAELLHDRPTPQEFAGRYLTYMADVLGRVRPEEVGAFIQAILEARSRRASVFLIGNGGSAATASHFANDLSVGTRSRGLPFRAQSLTDNIAVLTAVANDFGYDQIFTTQLKVLMNPGDVVVAISASGNSPNIVEAIRWASANGAVTMALTGFDGGVLRRIAGISVHVPTMTGEYGPVEDLHLVLNHLVGTYLRAVCEGETHS